MLIPTVGSHTQVLLREPLGGPPPGGKDTVDSVPSHPVARQGRSTQSRRKWVHPIFPGELFLCPDSLRVPWFLSQPVLAFTAPITQAGILYRKPFQLHPSWSDIIAPLLVTVAVVKCFIPIPLFRILERLGFCSSSPSLKIRLSMYRNYILHNPPFFPTVHVLFLCLFLLSGGQA